jgi:hypothetical protein
MKLKMKRSTISAFIFAIVFISQSSFSAAPAAKTLSDAKAAAALNEQIKLRQEQAQKYVPLIANLQSALETTDSSIKVLVLKIVNREQLNGALSINQALGKNEQTLLMGAVALENFSLLKLVLAYKPDLSQPDIRGNTALHYAGLCGVDPNITAQLLLAGASPLALNKANQTPLMLGTEYKWWKEQSLTHYHATLNGIALAIKKIDQTAIDAVDSQDISALITAILNYNFHAVDILLNNGTDTYKLCRGHPALDHALAVKKFGNKYLAQESALSKDLRKQSIEMIIKRLKRAPKKCVPAVAAKTQTAASTAAHTANHKLSVENTKEDKRKAKLKEKRRLLKSNQAFQPRGKSHTPAANPPAQKPEKPQESTVVAAQALAASVQLDEQKNKSEEVVKAAPHNGASTAAQKALVVNKEDLIEATLTQLDSLNLEFDRVIQSGSRETQEKMRRDYFKAINTLNQHKYQDDAKAQYQPKKTAYSKHNQLYRLINAKTK